MSEACSAQGKLNWQLRITSSTVQSKTSFCEAYFAKQVSTWRIRLKNLKFAWMSPPLDFKSTNCDTEDAVDESDFIAPWQVRHDLLIFNTCLHKYPEKQRECVNNIILYIPTLPNTENKCFFLQRSSYRLGNEQQAIHGRDSTRSNPLHKFNIVKYYQYF